MRENRRDPDRGVNRILNGQTRRKLLGTVAGALTIGAAGCTQYPKGEHTLTKGQLGTEEAENTGTDAPQGTENGNTETEANPTEAEKGGVYANAVDYLPASIVGKSGFAASQPQQIAGKDLNEDVAKALEEGYWFIGDGLTGLNMENQNLLVSGGEGKFITKGEREDLSQYGAEEDGEYGGFQKWKVEGDGTNSGLTTWPERIGVKDDLQLNSVAAGDDAADRELKRMIDTYNGKNQSIAEGHCSDKRR